MQPEKSKFTRGSPIDAKEPESLAVKDNEVAAGKSSERVPRKQIPWVHGISLVGTLATLAYFIVAIQFPRALMPKRELAVTQIGSVALKHSQLQLPSENLKILLGDRELRSPYIATLKIVNTGDVALMADQIRSLDISAGSGRQFISARTTETYPAKIDPVFRISGDMLTLVPLTLNWGQSITVSTLVEGGDPIISVRGEVLDAEPPSFSVVLPNKNRTLFRVVLFFAIAIASFSLLYFYVVEAWKLGFSRSISMASKVSTIALKVLTLAVCTAGGYMAMRKGFEAADWDDTSLRKSAVIGFAWTLAFCFRLVSRNVEAPRTEARW